MKAVTMIHEATGQNLKHVVNLQAWASLLEECALVLVFHILVPIQRLNTRGNRKLLMGQNFHIALYALTHIKSKATELPLL